MTRPRAFRQYRPQRQRADHHEKGTRPLISAPSKNAALAILCLVIFLDAMSVGLILPVMPSLIINLSTLPVSRAAEIGGYLLFIFAAMQFLFAPLLGALSDRFGRRRVLLLAVFGFSVDYFIMAAAPNLVWLFVARFLSGIFGATYAAANAGIVDITEPEKRARNFGLAGAAVGLGLSLALQSAGFWAISICACRFWRPAF